MKGQEVINDCGWGEAWAAEVHTLTGPVYLTQALDFTDYGLRLTGETHTVTSTETFGDEVCLCEETRLFIPYTNINHVRGGNWDG